MNVEKQALEKLLSFVQPMMTEATKTYELTKQILIVKISEWELFLRHVLFILEKEEQEAKIFVSKVGKA